jgi:hypothetical protein
MKSMVKLVTRAEKKGGRENLEASDKVLELLQSWGETFVNHQEKDSVRLFMSHYHELRIKGVRFPHPDTTQTTAVLTPSKRTAAPSTTTTTSISTSSTTITSTGASKDETAADPEPALQHVSGLPGEYSIIASTVEMVSDMLKHVATTEDLAENDVVTDLMLQIESIHGKVMSDLENSLMAGESPMLTGLLALNDNIHTVLRRREAIVSGRGGVGVGGGGGGGGGVLFGEAEREEEEQDSSDDDDDDDDDEQQQAGASITTTTLPITVAPPIVPRLSAPTSISRARTRSSPFSPSSKPSSSHSSSPLSTSNDLDDLLGLSLDAAPAAPTPPLRQQSEGFSDLVREDSGWSDFNSGDQQGLRVGTSITTNPLPVATSASSSSGGGGGGGLGDLASLYQSQPGGGGMSGMQQRMPQQQQGMMPHHGMQQPMTSGMMSSGGVQLIQRAPMMGGQQQQGGMLGGGMNSMQSTGQQMQGGMLGGGMQGGMMGGMQQQQQQQQQPSSDGMLLPQMHMKTNDVVEERPRSGSNPFDQFNPFDTAEKKKKATTGVTNTAPSTSSSTPSTTPNDAKRRPSNNPFDF